jgi:hypothetical protein
VLGSEQGGGRTRQAAEEGRQNRGRRGPAAGAQGGPAAGAQGRPTARPAARGTGRRLGGLAGGHALGRAVQ